MAFPDSFSQIGGRLAVDFANTSCLSRAPRALTLTWPHLIGFLQRAQVITADRAERLLALAENDPQSADALVRKAQELRQAIRELFEALVHKRRVPPSCIEAINSVLRITEGHDEMFDEGGALRLAFVARESSSEWLLAAIARSAAEIACEGPQGTRLRPCANRSCGLFFYDSSRTHRRRWCSMAVCGNRHKVAAFAHRHAAKQRLS